MADEVMPKFDEKKEKHLVNKTAIDFMKVMNEKNKERVEKVKRFKIRNKITGLCLGAFVLSVYGYSLVSVKQETFLDDFEPPVLLPKTDSKL